MLDLAMGEEACLVASDVVSSPREMIRIFSGEMVELASLVEIVLEHRPSAPVGNWPEFERGDDDEEDDNDGAFVYFLTLWKDGGVTDEEAKAMLLKYAAKYVVMHPDNQYANERQVKEAQAQRLNHANSSQEMIAATHMGVVNVGRKEMFQSMISDEMRNRVLGQNAVVKAGKASTRVRQPTGNDDDDDEELAKAPAYSTRWRYSNLSSLLMLEGLDRRGAESESLSTKANLKAVKSVTATATTKSGDEERRARVFADFQSKWEERRNGRSRALFADQPRPTMQPVVSPRLTNEYPLGVFNSRVKVVAELDAREVEYPPGAAYTALALILKGHEDVIISKVDGRKYLKRMGPSWEPPTHDDEGDENELIANAMAGGNLT
jgi:hypothetical protein